MGCYYTLCHNTYAYALLFYKVYIKRENAGSWNSGLEKEQILETYSAQLQKSWNSTEVIFWNNKKYWAKKIPEGANTLATGVGARPTPWAHPLPRGLPGGPPMPIFCYMRSFARVKIISKLTGWNSAATRWNLGGSNLELRQSCSTGETSLPEGGKHRHGHHQRSSHRERANLHQHLHHHHLLSNPSSSLVSNSCL